jgi:hypothetical protein
MVLARCSTKCAVAPTSPPAAGSLFCRANGQHAVMPAGCLLFLRSPNVIAVHPGETATILIWFHIDIFFSPVINCVYVLFCFVVEERNPVFCVEKASRLTLVGCSERCPNRNRHRPYKHRLGLFMVSRCLSLSIDSINYFEWMCVKCFGYAHW